MAFEQFYRAEGADLSEGIKYDNGQLWWVDIRNAEIHKTTSLDNPAKTHTSYKIAPSTYLGNYPYDTTEERVGCLLIYKDKLLFGGRYGIGDLNCSTGEWHYIYHYRDSGFIAWQRLRSNDGAIAPDGSIYIGLMVDFSFGGPSGEHPEGCVIKINNIQTEPTAVLVLDQIHIPNAMNWTKDSMYLNDSSQHTVWQIPFKGDEPLLSQRSVLFTCLGEPDGSMIHNNTMYLAVWSTGQLLAIDFTGHVIKEWILPTPNVTCCCIVENSIFVTTAKANDDDILGGSIFKLSI